MTYANNSGIHHQVIPVNYAGTPTVGTMPDLTTKSAGTVAADIGLDTWLSVFDQIFADDTVFGLTEAYTVDSDDEESHYLTAWDAAHAGAAMEGEVLNSGLCQTFKTLNGGILKIVGMGTVILPDIKNHPPYTPATAGRNISDYIVGSTSIFIGRDNSYAVAPISSTSKIYDVLRKRNLG